MINKAWDRNDDGGGVAWREPDANGRMMVKWKKGLEDKDGLEEMTELCYTLPVPYVAHFRVASCGGVRPSLTHPFLVDHTASTAIEGETYGGVLFHNGDWKGWGEACREAAIHSGVPIPPGGKWSDSRGMAWLCSIYGPGFMSFLPDQKGVYFTPDDYEVFEGVSNWKKINEVWCSNDYFLTPRNVSYVGTMCRYGQCTRTDIDAMHYCPAHTNGIVQSTIKKDTSPVVGGTQAPTPFPHPPVTAPALIRQEDIISLTVAEGLYQQKDPQTGKRRVSNSMIREIRKLYEKLKAGGKDETKARRTLLHLSAKLIGAGQLPLIPKD